MYNYTEEILEKIKGATLGAIKDAGYEMVEVTLRKVSGALTLRFLIDKPNGGISIAECAALNERLSRLLDTENILEERYVLEVSSPGIDRPLINEKDFLRVLGRPIRVFLKEPLKEKIEYAGALESVKDNFLFLNTEKATLKIPLDKIKKAKQVII